MGGGDFLTLINKVLLQRLDADGDGRMQREVPALVSLKRESILIELMTSDRKLKASRECTK